MGSPSPFAQSFQRRLFSVRVRSLSERKVRRVPRKTRENTHFWICTTVSGQNEATHLWTHEFIIHLLTAKTLQRSLNGQKHFLEPTVSPRLLLRFLRYVCVCGSSNSTAIDFCLDFGDFDDREIFNPVPTSHTAPPPLPYRPPPARSRQSPPLPPPPLPLSSCSASSLSSSPPPLSLLPRNPPPRPTPN